MEISVRSTEGDLRINSGYDITPDDLPVLSPQGPGRYRMRVHASGRSINLDGVSDEPVEDYLIAVGPVVFGCVVRLRGCVCILVGCRVGVGQQCLVDHLAGADDDGLRRLLRGRRASLTSAVIARRTIEPRAVLSSCCFP
ncbi:hypothetical protein [Streptomyces angustmyceticus]|uniref:hypothetical protein n=1 Tax=Streptomyces angustmyceticus TaxID=285578 RepID=UPI003D923005